MICLKTTTNTFGKKLDKDIEKWTKFNLLLGKIAVIKMVILPKILYLLQTIPIIKGVKQFEIWHKKLSNFIWSGKRARIRMKYLMDSKNRGGLQVPNFKIYQEAVY